MPNLVNTSTGGGGSSALIRFDPDPEEFFTNDKFYGIRFYPSNAKLIINEITSPTTITYRNDTTTDVVALPIYRVGDSNLYANGKYNGGETLASALANVPEGEYFDAYNHDVYKNWLTSQSTLTFSWYTDNKRLLVEVG